jgi:hypothetical protein
MALCVIGNSQRSINSILEDDLYRVQHCFENSWSLNGLGDRYLLLPPGVL